MTAEALRLLQQVERAAEARGVSCGVLIRYGEFPLFYAVAYGDGPATHRKIEVAVLGDCFAIYHDEGSPRIGEVLAPVSAPDDVADIVVQRLAPDPAAPRPEYRAGSDHPQPLLSPATAGTSRRERNDHAPTAESPVLEHQGRRRGR
ncbi:hypothetical protein [Actinomadura rayongensis]|uniref:Uncharacterized protein n=1 Tax=Actinomadura rayongensis TaxID=1429076 RepID=A0A6I4WCD2_9ACTN|nr:hypothetical protein [Actinomadura rayongensis]MXQ65596.1 hypothetical protein [Actinomadura rayongensis]